MSGSADPVTVALALVGITFALRVIPVILLTRMRLPPVVDRWLSVARRLRCRVICCAHRLF